MHAVEVGQASLYSKNKTKQNKTKQKPHTEPQIK